MSPLFITETLSNSGRKASSRQLELSRNFEIVSLLQFAGEILRMEILWVVRIA